MRGRERKYSLIFLIVLFSMLIVFFASSLPLQETSYAYNYDASSFFIARNAHELSLIASMSSAYDFSGKTVVLYENIFLNEEVSFTRFNGTFLGNGFIISGLSNSMFNTVGENAVISGLVFTNLNTSAEIQGLLAKTNNGTITDITVFGANCEIVYYNYGLIEKLNAFNSAFLDKCAVTVNYGSIESCLISGAISVSAKSESGFLANNNATTASINNCSVISTISYSGTELDFYPFGKFQDDGIVTACSALLSLNNAFVHPSVSSGIKNSYIYDGNSIKVFDDASGEQGTDCAKLGEEFFKTEGFYPYLKTLFEEKQGTIDSKFSINDILDIHKLAFCVSKNNDTQNGFYAELTDDIFGDKAPLDIFVYSGGELKGQVDGNGHIFAKTAISPFSGTDISAIVTVEEGFGGDGYVEGCFKTVSLLTPIGLGTEDEPYLICNAQTLMGVLADENKNQSGKYALITQDIILNNSNGGNYILSENAPDINLNLYGGGNSIVNTLISPFGTINGGIENLKILLSTHQNIDYGVCGENKGNIKRVEVTKTGSYSVLSGFSAKNSGNIEYSQNNIMGTVNAFVALNESDGQVSYCTSKPATNFVETNNGAMFFCAMPSLHIDGSGLQKEGGNYFILKNSSFDMENIFGYVVGGDEVQPEIRTSEKKYRVLGRQGITVTPPLEIGYSTFLYDGVGILKEDIESSVVIDSDSEAIIDYDWEYNGTDYITSDSIINAGEYTLTITVSGNKYITESLMPFTITMEKGVYSDGIINSAFIDKQFDYNGENIVDEPIPTNVDELESAGFILTYTVTKEGITTDVCDSGVYAQTLTASSDNYETLIKRRKITVNRIDLLVTVKNCSVEYNSEADFSQFNEKNTTVNGLVGKDISKTLVELVTENGQGYTAFFVSNYEKGNDVGEYELGYSLLYTLNYNLSVTEGKLVVEAIEISGYKFESASYTYDGLNKSILMSGLPEGASVSYMGNDMTNANTYTVTATVTHKNYKTLEANASLIIEKAEIILSVSSAEKKYGYEFIPSDFTYNHTGLVNGEEFLTVTQGIIFTPTIGSFSGALHTGEYTVDLIIEGVSENYRFTVKKGTLTVDKAYLFKIFASNLYLDVETEYTGEAIEAVFPENAFENMSVEFAYNITQKGIEVSEIIDVGEYEVTATVTPTGDTAENYYITEYSCTVTVTLISTKIIFSSEKYIFNYNGTDYSNKGNFLYTVEKIPSDAEINIFFTKKGTRVTEIINAGEYNVVAEYLGDGNLADARTTVPVSVKACVATLAVANEYIYNGKKLAPIIEFSYGGTWQGSLREDELSFSYIDKYNTTLGTVAEAGDYTLNIVTLNENYLLETGTFPVKIKPLEKVISIDDLTFEYGTNGEYYSGENEIVINGNIVTKIGYYIEETERTENIVFRLQESDLPLIHNSDGTPRPMYFPIGEYSVTSDLLVQPKNYSFTLRKAFAVQVTKRTLSVMWTFDGRYVTTNEVSMTYAGKAQNERIGYVLSGFAQGEGMANANAQVSVKQGITDVALYYVGEYTVSIFLTDTPSYILNNTTSKITAKIIKAPLISIVISDVQVMQYENIGTIDIRADGLLGDDVGKAVNRLRGYTFKANTAYKASSASVGEVYLIGGEFAFSDYIVSSENIASGRLTVVQGYKKYILPDIDAVYDGTAKVNEIANLEEGVLVEYFDNSHTEMGMYDAFATITYPTGRTVSLKAKTVIRRANPIINCPTEYGAYIEDYELTKSDINATATLNSVVLTVPGTYTFTSGSKISRGNNSISIIFSPTDTRNFNPVSFTKTVVKYEINGNALKYSHRNYSMKEEKLYINEALGINLDKSEFPQIADDVSLYFNNDLTSNIVLKRTAKEVISIKYKQIELYKLTLNVVFGEKEEEKEPIIVTHKILKTRGVEFSDDGLTLYLAGETGTIELMDEYKERYDLYINGRIVDSFTVDKETGNITVMIKSKSLGVSLYNKTSEINIGEKPTEPSEEITIDQPTEFKTYYYYIIGAVVALVIAGVIILLLKLKK